MNEVHINKSDIAFLKFSFLENSSSVNVSSSQEGYLAIRQSDSLVIGTINHYGFSDHSISHLTPAIVDLQTPSDNSIIRVVYRSTKNDERSEIIEMNIDRLMTSYNTISAINANLSVDNLQIEWSPFDQSSNKSHLALMQIDGRLVLLSFNKSTDRFEKEFDLLDFYHRYYKENFLSVSDFDESGAVLCCNIDQYIRLMSDLRLLSFSWSALCRKITNGNQYRLLAVLAESGLMIVWRIIENDCELIYHYRFESTALSRPMRIQCCDLSANRLMIIVYYTDQRIVAHLYQINRSIDGDDKSLELISTHMVRIPIDNRFGWCQSVKTCWVINHSLLIVGFVSELLLIKFEVPDATESTPSIGRVSAVCSWFETPSHGTVTGLVVKDNTVIFSTRDGHLFVIKLDTTFDQIDLIQLRSECRELESSRKEIITLFLSPNGAQLGCVIADIDRLSSQSAHGTLFDLVLITLMSEKELLSILMDNSRPLWRKGDVLEVLRQIYWGQRHMYNSALSRLARCEIVWECGDIYGLQLARLLCVLFGYRLDQSLEQHRSSNDMIRMRRLESHLVINSVLNSIDSLIKCEKIDRSESDFWLSLLLAVRVRIAISNIVTDQSIAVLNLRQACETAVKNTRGILAAQYGAKDIDLDRCESETLKCVCPVCQDNCAFSLHACSCHKGHVTQRCCKTLELCTADTAVDKCTLCGAVQISRNNSTITNLSNWRLERISSNCPFCEGKFRKI